MALMNLARVDVKHGEELLLFAETTNVHYDWSGTTW